MMAWNGTMMLMVASMKFENCCGYCLYKIITEHINTSNMNHDNPSLSYELPKSETLITSFKFPLLEMPVYD